MEIVILEAIHGTGLGQGDVIRISQLYDDDGEPAAFIVYKGNKVDENYRLEFTGEHTTLSAAVQQFTEELKKIMGVQL